MSNADIRITITIREAQPHDLDDLDDLLTLIQGAIKGEAGFEDRNIAAFARQGSTKASQDGLDRPQGD